MRVSPEKTPSAVDLGNLPSPQWNHFGNSFCEPPQLPRFPNRDLSCSRPLECRNFPCRTKVPLLPQRAQRGLWFPAKATVPSEKFAMLAGVWGDARASLLIKFLLGSPSLIPLPEVGEDLLSPL